MFTVCSAIKKNYVLNYFCWFWLGIFKARGYEISGVQIDRSRQGKAALNAVGPSKTGS